MRLNTGHTGRSTVLPNPDFIRGMASLGGARVKLFSLLSLVLWPFFKLVRWGQFVSSIAISVVLVGIIAGAVTRPYIRDRVVAYRRLAPNRNGVGDVTNPS